MVDLALYQPDIAKNTGAMLRLGACLGATVHIIHPTGFPFSRHAVKHGALDYFELAALVEHDDWTSFDAWRHAEARRLALLTTKAGTSVYETGFQPGDILLLGRETAGVPETVASAADLQLRIPMREGTRSLNVVTAASLVLGEALRQTGGFAALG